MRDEKKREKHVFISFFFLLLPLLRGLLVAGGWDQIYETGKGKKSQATFLRIPKAQKKMLFPEISHHMLGFTGFYWVSRGFTGFYWVS